VQHDDGGFDWLDELKKNHKTTPSVKKTWVRKADTIYPLRGSGSGLT